MHETQILTNLPSSSERHLDQWQALRQAQPGLAGILDAINAPQEAAIIFSHDDPDGITSGLILERTLQRKGWQQVHLEMPAGFPLTPEQFDAALARYPNAKAVFISDKGTLPQYTDYGKRLPVYVIDHHPSAKPPTNCTVFNPALERYVPCSTSLLAHGIATLLGVRDAFDDFLCLVGLKGDWAIEPVKGVLVDFAKPFFVEYGMQFKNLLTLLDERPTMFDAEQRTHTCLLSRVSEFVHGTGGGGFQYFYHDRHPSLAEVDHPQCIAAGLRALAGRAADLTRITTLESFIKMLPQPQQKQLDRIFGFFLEDWARAERLLDSSVRMTTLERTGIYLFVGAQVPLLPMIGSIKLFELKKQGNDDLAMIVMVSAVRPDYTHVSVRGSGDRVHSGKFCGHLQNSLHQHFTKNKDRISGGGHPRAAECTIRTDQPTALKVLEYVVSQMADMTDLDGRYQKGSLKASDRKRAEDLGLEYIRP